MEKVVYHGRRGNPPFTKGRPVFFTDNKGDAEWYAYERGKFEEEPAVNIATVDINRSASYEDLMQAVKETDAAPEDIREFSPYEGSNPIDYLYVPKVVKKLREMGFDSYQGWDVLTNTEIPITVIFDSEQVISYEQIFLKDAL